MAKKPSSVELTHFGRKSGKPFKLRVWFTEIDGDLWVGTRDVERNWVKNLRSTGRTELDFGDGASAYAATEGDERELEAFERAILSKHPIGARIINFLARGKTPTCFRVKPAG